jgi:hypothetical protein
MSQYFDLLVTLGFLSVLMWGMLRFMLRDIHKDLMELKTGQAEIKAAQAKSDARIDHLYQMFVDLLKEKK